MASGFVCYHHRNDSSRHAVATCTKCGKNLCSECVDTFKGANGKVLCGDCKKQEISETYAMLNATKSALKKELIGIGVGLIIGIVAMAILLSATSIGGWAVLFPFAFASLFTIIHKVSDIGAGFIVSLLIFLVFFVISPIVLIYRIIVRIKHIKKIKAISLSLAKAHYALDKYTEMAAQVTGVEEIQRNELLEKIKQLEAKSAQDAESNAEKTILLNKIKELEARQAKAEAGLQNVQKDMSVNFEDLQTQINGMK